MHEGCAAKVADLSTQATPVAHVDHQALTAGTELLRPLTTS